MIRARRTSLFLILLSAAISVLWGFAVERSVPGGALGFQGVYYGTRCLMQHCDPYQESELQSLYRAEGGERPGNTIQRLKAVTLYVNLPTTFIIIAPLALLSWGPAHLLWIVFIIGGFTLAAVLMWSQAESQSPGVALFLTCILLANSEVVFATGNTAGIVVSLCVIAVWCFLTERFALAGILCLAVSLAIKPHDAGLVWLYFVLAGGVNRKRALQSLAITVVLGLAAVLWVSQAAPHWLPEMRSNLAAISAHGGINEPGPTSVGASSPDMVIDLQTVISVFRDDPRFYNPVSYLVCGALLAVWAVKTLRSRFSPARAWLALGAVAPLTMLVTYHRSYDAKLLLLTIPACALLWAEGGLIGWLSLVLNSAGIVFTGDIPLAILARLTGNLNASTASFAGKILAVALARPAPLILLAMSIFYLWVYVRRVPAPHATAAMPLRAIQNQ
jgi:hypothetical protein